MTLYFLVCKKDRQQKKAIPAVYYWHGYKRWKKDRRNIREDIVAEFVMMACIFEN